MRDLTGASETVFMDRLPSCEWYIMAPTAALCCAAMNLLSLYGAVEAGGTKFIVALGNERGEILEEHRFPTTEPAATLAETCAWLRRKSREGGHDLAAIGIASFGPVELDRSSSRFGCIGQTPKAGWSGTDIAGVLAREFMRPIGFDTDVNAAALAEHRWGAARDIDHLVYLTVGTGIGGGVIVDGAPIHGLMHPEIGHIYPRRHSLDEFGGVCPFHRDCLEGLASGPAILARTGSSLQKLDPAHSQWQIEADYLGQLCAQLVVTISPRRIVMGGGVMAQTSLLPLIRDRMRHWLGGYINRAEILADADHYVVAPQLGGRSGILGALALAMDAAAHR
jgi:fructokinase